MTSANKHCVQLSVKLHGQPIIDLPQDLYIPPGALEVFLETFQGPLDLLLYLIKKNNIDIVDIPVANITEQYMSYIELMKVLNLELAAEYLLMAAVLTEIKSRMLLPSPAKEGDDEDPRAELVRRLQEYDRFKKAAEDLRQRPLLGRDTFLARAQTPDIAIEKPKPKFDLHELVIAFKEVMTRAEMYQHHRIIGEPLSVRERMSIVLSKVQSKAFVPFHELFTVQEGKKGIVVTFIAILELLKVAAIELVQAEPYAPIHVKQVGKKYE